MDLYEDLYCPIDTIALGTLTLAIFPMFIAIGQLFFNGGYYLPQNQYLKIYIDNFNEFVDQYFVICPLLTQESLSVPKKTFAYINSWQIVKDSGKTVCEFHNSKEYKIKFSFFQLTNLYIKFQLVLFKPLCLPATYSLNLSKFAIFLSKNPNYTPKQIKKFSYETIESFIVPLQISQNIDSQYLTELIYRYKKLLVAYLNIQTICELDEEDDDNETATSPRS